MPGPTFTLFVYGTLLRGEESHALLEGATFLGEAKTVASYRLVDLGTYPGLVRGGDLSVVGELYSLDAPTLATIDVHKGHPVLFKRDFVELDGGGDAQAYHLDQDQVRGRRRLAGGSWRERSAKATVEGGVRDAAFVRWARSRTR
ncbi:Hypothetical protein A7982_04170 [Minicystis rosea]|nr:Hypothetical protein A7982_04170 [Minicystis rosea]